MKTILTEPIGYVKNGITNKAQFGENQEEAISCIVIEPELEAEGALENIEEYSHLWIIFWLDRLPLRGREIRKIWPAGQKEEAPYVGCLATRTPFRPNPFGLTMVRLIKRNKNLLYVQGLDAFDGTPVLDIKPYTGHQKDMVKEFKAPWWANEPPGKTC